MKGVGKYVLGRMFFDAHLVEHIESVLQLLNVMDSDHRFETAVNNAKQGKEARTMSEWLTRVINESEARGISKGREKGWEEGLEKGREEGLEKGKDEANLSGIRNIMKKMKYSAKTTMDFMEISAADQGKYAPLLKAESAFLNGE